MKNFLFMGKFWKIFFLCEKFSNNFKFFKNFCSKISFYFKFVIKLYFLFHLSHFCIKVFAFYLFVSFSLFFIFYYFFGLFLCIFHFVNILCLAGPNELPKKKSHKKILRKLWKQSLPIKLWQKNFLIWCSFIFLILFLVWLCKKASFINVKCYFKCYFK